jgi:SAM-dependent methyltransferase
LEPETVYRWCSPGRRLRPPFLNLVSLPTWLGRRQPRDSGPQATPIQDPEKTRFILNMTYRRLRRALRRLQPSARRSSTWSDYMDTLSYTPEAFRQKEDFVRQALAEAKPRSVLDVGANTGHFSALAARAGARVVAVDFDGPCVNTIWRRAHDEALDILPLVVDLARPTPALGWRNRETPSFLARARGHFDCVLMLAVLHHLLVTERIPLREALALAAELTTGYLLIEWVGPEDPMFRRIVRGRDHLHTDASLPSFEQACAERFVILRRQRLGESQRWLFWLRKKDDAP